MIKKTMLVILSAILVLSLSLTGCVKAPSENASQTPDANNQTKGKSPALPTETTGSNYQEGEKIKIGVSAAVTGEAKMMGEFVKKGALLAEKHINEAGGILGKELEIVFADEGDNVQSAVTAASKLLNDASIMGMVGPQTSTYSVASDQVVRDAQKPYFASGSSLAIYELGNTWMHQQRLTDDKAATITSKVMTEEFGVKNPAIIYINDSYGVGTMERTVKAFAALGVEIPSSNLYATNVDEKQYTTILSQIINSDVDGIYAAHHLVPASLIMMQAADLGVDIPCVGSSSYSSAITIQSAGDAAFGWYSCGDWAEDGQVGVAKEFVDAYHGEYESSSDKASVYAYDGIMLLAEACKLANTTDPTSVNNALLNDIKDYQGVMAKYNSKPERSMADSMLFTLNEPTGVTLIKRYEY